MKRSLAILISVLLGIIGMSFRVFSSIDTLDLGSQYDMDEQAKIIPPLGAQDSSSNIVRSTKSYLMADLNSKDISLLKEKCRQASLDLGHVVMANRIPTDSKLVSPIPAEHLLKQGTLQLQLPMDEKQNEFAVYHSELFDQPAYINVLQIGDELITYRTTEKSGDIQLFYGCVRGAFGTKRSAHPEKATVYKLWDTPERTLLPDLELQAQMAQAEAKRLAETDYPLLIFNDLNSYAYIQGDSAICSFLDTMHKYNPDKLLQADVLTPASWYYLSRVNENQLWNESMRTKIVETLSEKQEFYRNNLMPWMIGNFQILLADKNRKATTMEELEWFLSKAAAFDAGFGLIFDAEIMKKHGLTDEMLNIINIWETLRLTNAFTEEQKEQFKDPYGNWHLEKKYDSTYRLYSQHISRRYFCNFKDDTWNWNSPYKSRFALQIAVDGKGNISELEFRTPNGILHFPCTIKAGQYLIYDFDGSAFITDMNYNKIEEILPQGVSFLEEGLSEVTFASEVQPEGNKKPEVTVRYITRSEGESIALP